ncbi:hypothetical protein [Endozoicomonas euniceicola]|uniref:Uncharacterized protein n=1 Tax=Endozoicomonas euniceicola TaxID=1234143 RepID=A0ABY6GQ33_9GAMM|nr:hypothetical protein [Endozoicomonas euniceicola]UYM14261.1 hypothetical protein NX720_15290 [Endozoicomonas euniceicola]
MTILINNQTGNAESTVQSVTGTFYLQISGQFNYGLIRLFAEIAPGAGYSLIYETTATEVVSVDLPYGAKYKAEIVSIEGSGVTVTAV